MSLMEPVLLQTTEKQPSTDRVALRDTVGEMQSCGQGRLVRKMRCTADPHIHLRLAALSEHTPSTGRTGTMAHVTKTLNLLLFAKCANSGTHVLKGSQDATLLSAAIWFYGLLSVVVFNVRI
jgi:hypothetical protein